MYISLLIIYALLGNLHAIEKCPDNNYCNGNCCRKFPFLRKYYCCKPENVCVSMPGFGACLPKPIAEIVVKVLKEEGNLDQDSDEQFYDDGIVLPWGYRTQKKQEVPEYMYIS